KATTRATQASRFAELACTSSRTCHQAASGCRCHTPSPPKTARINKLTIRQRRRMAYLQKEQSRRNIGQRAPAGQEQPLALFTLSAVHAHSDKIPRLTTSSNVSRFFVQVQKLGIRCKEGASSSICREV